jgi:hypothetical protein
MDTKYYVAMRAQINENHAVHKEGCPFLPDDKKRIYLGEFGSGADALIEGHRHFSRTNSCIFCSEEHDKDDTITSISDWVRNEIIPAKLEIPASFQHNLFCCLN